MTVTAAAATATTIGTAAAVVAPGMIRGLLWQQTSPEAPERSGGDSGGGGAIALKSAVPLKSGACSSELNHTTGTAGAWKPAGRLEEGARITGLAARRGARRP